MTFRTRKMEHKEERRKKKRTKEIVYVFRLMMPKG